MRRFTVFTVEIHPFEDWGLLSELVQMQLTKCKWSRHMLQFAPQ